MAKGVSTGTVSEVEEADPIAPANPPTSESAAEVAQAARNEKQRLRNAFSSKKTILAGNTLGSTAQEGNTKLGGA